MAKDPLTDAAREFRDATRALKNNAIREEDNIFLRDALLFKEKSLLAIEESFLGKQGIKQVIEFIQLKKQERQLKKSMGIEVGFKNLFDRFKDKENFDKKRQFKENKKNEKQRKKEVANAKQNKAIQDAEEKFLISTMGNEEGRKEIEKRKNIDIERSEGERTNAAGEKIKRDERLFERDMILAFDEKEQMDLEAADRKKKREEEEKLAKEEEGKINSLTEAAQTIEASFVKLADSLQTIIGASGASGEGGPGGDDALAAEQMGVGASSEVGPAPTTDDGDALVVNATPEGGNGNDTLIAAANSITAELQMMRAEQSGEGESPAERDKAKAEAAEASAKQLDLLQKIADNISGGGAGGGGSTGSGDGGGGMLAKLGGGIGALGKGIGVFLKSVGSGAGKLITSIAKGFAALGKALGPIGKGIGRAIAGILKGFAKGVMAFANPIVIAGLAVFTLGMIGLGAALRLAAPAFEALAPVMIKIADIIGNVLMKVIEEFAPVLIKIADVIGNVFIAAIEAIPAILREIGGIITSVGGAISDVIDSIGNSIRKVGEGIKEVLNGISGVIVAIGDTISGVITSVAEGIATVVNAVRGDAKAEAEAQIAVLNAQTESIQKLSKIDPGTMAATASGIESIKEALDGLGSPGLFGALGKMLGGGGPISELLELAKNSQGITDASTAINEFVKNAKLFEKGVDIDDSVIEGIEKVVKALGSGNPAGLSAFDKAINSINGLDASKISLLQGIKIPEITPQTAAEYEKVFNAMQKNQPDLIDKVSSTLGRFFGRSPREARAQRPQRGAPKARSRYDERGMRTDDPNYWKDQLEVGPDGAIALKSAAKDVSKMTNAEFKKQNPREQRRTSAAPDNMGMVRQQQRINQRALEISANPPTAAGSMGGGGGSNVSISAPTTNSSQSHSSSPITNRPSNPALERMRSSVNF